MLQNRKSIESEMDGVISELGGVLARLSTSAHPNDGAADIMLRAMGNIVSYSRDCDAQMESMRVREKKALTLVEELKRVVLKQKQQIEKLHQQIDLQEKQKLQLQQQQEDDKPVMVETAVNTSLTGQVMDVPSVNKQRKEDKQKHQAAVEELTKEASKLGDKLTKKEKTILRLKKLLAKSDELMESQLQILSGADSGSVYINSRGSSAPNSAPNSPAGGRRASVATISRGEPYGGPGRGGSRLGSPFDQNDSVYHSKPSIATHPSSVHSQRRIYLENDSAHREVGSSRKEYHSHSRPTHNGRFDDGDDGGDSDDGDDGGDSDDGGDGDGDDGDGGDGGDDGDDYDDDGETHSAAVSNEEVSGSVQPNDGHTFDPLARFGHGLYPPVVGRSASAPDFDSGDENCSDRTPSPRTSDLPSPRQNGSLHLPSSGVRSALSISESAGSAPGSGSGNRGIVHQNLPPLSPTSELWPVRAENNPFAEYEDATEHMDASEKVEALRSPPFHSRGIASTRDNREKGNEQDQDQDQGQEQEEGEFDQDTFEGSPLSPVSASVSPPTQCSGLLEAESVEDSFEMVQKYYK